MWIPELEMSYYKARVYSYKLGRFMQTDPIGYEDQVNLYAYVGNDPINTVDPQGEARVAIGVGVIVAGGRCLMNSGCRRVVVNLAKKGVREATKIRDRIGPKIKPRRNRCCFVAGTLVDTEAGLRPIEEIEVGDRVWAWDEATGQVELKPVTDLIRRHQRVIWEVALTGLDGETQSFETTDDHPWWIAGQGWKKTEELVAGMSVVTRDGQGMIVTSIVETDRTDATFNLTVADFNTYFVGEHRVLVHNDCSRKTKHTDNRHSTRSKYPEKSKFKKPSQADKLRKKTESNPDRVVPQGNRTRYERDFGRDVGTRGERTVVSVKDNKTGKNVTQFPKKTDE